MKSGLTFTFDTVDTVELKAEAEGVVYKTMGSLIAVVFPEHGLSHKIIPQRMCNALKYITELLTTITTCYKNLSSHGCFIYL